MHRTSASRLFAVASLAVTLNLLLLSPELAQAAAPSLDQTEIWLGVEGEPGSPVTERTVNITAGANTVNSVVSANTGVAVILGWLPGANSFIVRSVNDGDTTVTVTNPEGETYLEVHVGLSASVPDDGEIYLSPPAGWNPTYTLTINRHYGAVTAEITDINVATISDMGGGGGPDIVTFPADPNRPSETLVITGVAIGTTYLDVYDHDSGETMFFRVYVVAEQPPAIAFSVTDVTSGAGSAVAQGGRIPIQRFTMSATQPGGTLEWLHLQFWNANDGAHLADGLVQEVDPSLYDGHDQVSEIRRVIVRWVTPAPPPRDWTRWFYTLYEVETDDLVVEFGRQGAGAITIDLRVNAYIPSPPSPALTCEVLVEIGSAAMGFEPEPTGRLYGFYRDKFVQRLMVPTSRDIIGPFTGPDKPPPPYWPSFRVHVVSSIYDATPTGPSLSTGILGPAVPSMQGAAYKEFPLFQYFVPALTIRPRPDFSPTTRENFYAEVEAREIMPQEQHLAALAVDFQGPAGNRLTGMYVVFEEIDPTGLENTFDPFRGFNMPTGPSLYNPVTLWQDNGDGLFDPASDTLNTQSLSWLARPGELFVNNPPRPYDLDGDNQMEYICFISTAPYNLDPVDDYLPDFFVVVRLDSGQRDESAQSGDRRPIRFGTDFTAYALPYVYDYDIESPIFYTQDADPILQVTDIRPAYVLPDTGERLNGVVFTTYGSNAANPPMQAIAVPESLDSRSDHGRTTFNIETTGETRTFLGVYPSDGQDPLLGFPGRLWNKTISINDDLVKPISAAYNIEDTVTFTLRADESHMVSRDYFHGLGQEFTMPHIDPDPYTSWGVDFFDQHIDSESVPTCALSVELADLAVDGAVPGAVGEVLSSIRVNLRGGVGVLMEDIDESQTEFNVRSTSGFSHHGSLQIDDEIIAYANIPEMYLSRDLDADERTIYVTMNPELCDYLFPGKIPEDKFNEFPASGYLDINGEIIYYRAKGNWVGIDPLQGDPRMSYGTFVSVQRGVYGNRPSSYSVFTRVRSLQIQGARRGAGVRYDPLEGRLVAGTIPTSHLADKIVACATLADLFKLTPDMLSGISLWMDNKGAGNVGTFDPIIDYMIDTDGTASTGSNFNPIDPDTDDVVPGYGNISVQGERFSLIDDIYFQDLDGDNEYSLGEVIFEDRNDDGAFSAAADDLIIYDPGFGITSGPAFINAGDINVRRILHIDGNANTRYDDGEDIFFDGDFDGLYETPVDILVRLHPDETRWRFDQQYDHDNDGFPEGTFFMILDPTEGLEISNFDRYNQAFRGPDFFVCLRTSDSVTYNDRIQIEIPDYDQLDGRVPITTPTVSPIPKKYTRGFMFEDVPRSRWIPIPLEMVDLGEDLNYNGIQDPDEDEDNDGLWEPGQFFDSGDQDDEEESYDSGIQLFSQPSADEIFFPIDDYNESFEYLTHFRSAPGSRKMSSPLICNVPIQLEDLVNVDPATDDLHVPLISQPLPIIGLNTWDIERDLSFPIQLFLNQVIVEFYDQDPQMPDPFPDFDPFSGDLRQFHKNPRRDCDSGIALYRDDNARTTLTRTVFPEDTTIEVQSTSASIDDTGTATDPFDPPAPTHDGFVVNEITFTDDLEFIRIGGEWIAYTEMTETTFTVLDDTNTSEVEGRGLFGTSPAEHEADDLVTAGINGWFDWFADDEWNIFVVDDPVLLDSHPKAPTTSVSTDPAAVVMLFRGTSEIYTPSGASPEPVPVNDIGINEGNDFFVVIRTGEKISHGDDFTTGIVSWGFTWPVYNSGHTFWSRALGFADISPETSQQSLYTYLHRWLFHVDLPEDTRACKTLETGALFPDETMEPPRPTPPPTVTVCPSPTAGPVAVLFAKPWVALNAQTLSQYRPVSQLTPLIPRDQISLGVDPTASAPYDFELLVNNSGAASLVDLSAGNDPYQSVLYTAGPLAGVTDIVRVTDRFGQYTDVVIAVVPEEPLRVYLADGEGYGGYEVSDGEQIQWEAGSDLVIWAKGGELPYTFVILINNSDADLVTTETDGSFVLKVTYTPGNAVGAVDTIRITDADSILYDPDTFITFTIKVVSPGSLPTFIWGDVNGDGQLTPADPMLAARIEAGLAEPASVRHAIAGDVDGDGRLTILDALYIRRVVEHQIPSP